MKDKKLIRRARKGKPIKQVAALPLRRSVTGELEVLLVTSRRTGRFIIPKGWPLKGHKDWKAAALEASQEAGVSGEFDKQPIATFQYWKRLKDRFVSIEVDVYPLRVEAEHPNWKERDQRSRAWVTPAQAATLVDETQMMSLLTALRDFNLDY